MRPFNPVYKNRFQYEVKYGEKKKSGSKSYPTKLDHLKIVSRDRLEDNFTKLTHIHDIIGDRPKVIPIRFFTDNPNEILSMYRAAFDKSTLMCGAHLGEQSAMRRFDMEGTDVDENGIHSGGKIKAPVSMLESPFRYKCDDSCPLWTRNKCKFYGKLHFFLDVPDVPESGAFFVLRVNSVFSQMSLASSIDIIKNMTGGLLSNIPLRLRLDYEKLGRKVQVGSKSMNPDIPYLSIELGVDYPRFMNIVRAEYRARREGEHDKFVMSVLGPSLTRNSLLEEHEEDDVPSEIEDQKPKVDLDGIFEGTGYSARKKELLIQQHDGDPEKLKQAVEKDIVF